MFDRRSDEVPLTSALKEQRIYQTANRQVIGLGASSGEYNFARICVEKRGCLGSGPVERGLGALAKCVNRRRISKLSPQAPRHGINYFGRGRGSSVIVEVNPHDSFDPSIGAVFRSGTLLTPKLMPIE